MKKLTFEEIRARYSGENENKSYDTDKRLTEERQSRNPPFAGISTLLDAPYHVVDWEKLHLWGFDAVLLGIPFDLGITNRNGCRFGPRAIRTIERVGPYNHVLDCVPLKDLVVADIGDIPFKSRYDLEGGHKDIELVFKQFVEQGVVPVTAGGDHSITLPILRALGAKEPVGLIHIDAHADTGGPLEETRFHHGGPFRQAVLDGVLDPSRTIQIGIRGSADYLWEFSHATGMTVVHAEELDEFRTGALHKLIRDIVGDKPTYISFDIDSLDPAFAPGTGTPEIGGLSTREALDILRSLKGLNIIGGDVVEVAPQYDATTNTAHAGAQMLFEILSLIVYSGLTIKPHATNKT